MTSFWDVGEPEDKGGNSQNAPGVPTFSVETEIRCVWLASDKAHQQPITCLDCEGGKILTGGQDHCLKVSNLAVMNMIT